MFTTSSQFDQYASRGFNRIPVTREVLADLDTPLSTFLKLVDGSYSYLFESVQGGEKWGRYSIIGLPCQTTIKISANNVTVSQSGQVTESLSVADPLEWIRTYRSFYKTPDIKGLPRFTGGLVGYFGYDTIRYIEPHLKICPNPDPLGVPDILLMVSEEVVVFDNLTGKLYIVLNTDPAMPNAYGAAQARIDELESSLRGSIPASNKSSGGLSNDDLEFVSHFDQSQFEAGVELIKQYITDGDVMQVVLSQRMSTSYEAEPLDLYRALRSLNPSPYMYYLDLSEFYIVGSSPEILTQLENGNITVRPIAGTRPRGETEERDLALESELLEDPKELAEHLMLIDLGRNDVGRVAETGSVELTERMIVERYSHVMHIVSNVQGKLRSGMDAIDVLRATFPAGTISGAPKVQAMHVIDELEPIKRGIYSGAVGYIGWNGNMDTAIAIRTAVIKDEQLYLQAGAGIVADSVPSKEWLETMSKGRAISKAVSLVGRGLNR